MIKAVFKIEFPPTRDAIHRIGSKFNGFGFEVVDKSYKKDWDTTIPCIELTAFLNDKGDVLELKRRLGSKKFRPKTSITLESVTEVLNNA